MQKISNIFPDLAPSGVPPQALWSPGRLASFALSFLQLAGLLLIMRQFGLEKGSGISAVIPLILGAFAVTALVPLKFRPAVLFSLSICIIYYAFGYFSGSVMVIASLVIIGCCHLPIQLWMRVGLILVIGLGMAALRANLFYAPRASLVVPYIASMFMFRVIIYLYELKYSKLPSTLFQKLSYFFMFPNHCFLLFPIVDYKTYLKTYYDKPDGGIWQKGIRWMLRGATQLIVYRLIYYYLLIGPNDVHNLATMLQYMTCSYAIILRLSGLFHFAAGLLCIFGMNLPPVFNNYLLATSFVSLWQRINVYWREFMMKIFFYPIMFKYKKTISRNLLAATMLTVFVITWAVHNYQWFWIRGNFILTPMDMLFWGTLGICITINSVWLERSLGKTKKVLRPALAYPLTILKMTGIFLFMSVMWSLWNSGSIGEWGFLLSKGAVFTNASLMAILGIFAGIILAGALLLHVFSTEKIKRLIAMEPGHTLSLTLPAIAILLCLSFKSIQSLMPASLQPFVSSLTSDKLNNTDKESSERGYYKKLIDGDNNGGSGLWETSIKRPKTFTSIDDITTRPNGLLSKIFRPNASIRVNDYTIQTNSFGLRDRPYDLVAPKGHFRMALLGGSYEMGSGVNNNEVYEQVTEDRLNKTNTDTAIRAFEILNFGVGGYHLLQQVELCNTTVYQYQPDAVVYVAHTNESKRFLGFLTTSIQSGIDLKYPFMKQIKTLSGIKQSMSKVEIRERLEPFVDVMILWCYSEIARTSREHHAVPVWVFLPTTADPVDDAEYEKIKGYATRLGFVTLDLRGVYGNADRTKIRVSEWDTHPNATGQHMIAEKFYAEFKKHEDQVTKHKK